MTIKFVDKSYKTKNNFLENIFNFIIFIPITSFIVGFLLDENSAGSGNYLADIDWIKNNINIFLNNDLLDAIFHPDLYGNRPPLIYILNKYLNPFFNDFEKYRLTVFTLSLLGPIFLYNLLRIKFNLIDKRVLFLISSLIYLSPYYRSTAFWGANENYGIISMILSFLFFVKYFKSKKEGILNLVLLVFFSSLSVYFDQKLLIVPLISFLFLINSNIKTNHKILIFFSYLSLSLPYLYLIYKWNGLVPPASQINNPKTVTSISDLKNLFFIHLGYSSTIMSFYLLPLISLTGDFDAIKKRLKNILNDKKIFFLIFLCILYISYNFIFFDFEKFTVSEYWVGLGIVHKLTTILTQNIFYQEIITYLFFLFSFIVLIYFYYIKRTDILIISYFLVISVFLWPLMQEYFDPSVLIISLSMFVSLNYLNKANSMFLMLYFSIFLIIANIYYSNII